MHSYGAFKTLLPLLVLTFFLCTVHPLRGRAVNGTLLGTVADSTGAAIANAKVTVTESNRGVIHQSATNDSGNYTFPDLPPGNYSVTVEASGFKNATQQSINLASNSSTRIDVTIEAGSVAETVLVTTAPPAHQTDRADISTKLEVEAIVDMPLTTNRNFQ